MNKQPSGPIGWHPRDIPPPGTLLLLSPSDQGVLFIQTMVPGDPYGETSPMEPLDAFLPLAVADSIRELADGVLIPGESISTQISGGSVENEIRLTLCRLSDQTVSVIFGDVVSCCRWVGADTLHQTSGDIPDMISRHDEGLVFTSATPSSFTLFGYRPSELSGTSLISYIHPDDRPRVETGYLPVISKPGVVRIRYRLRNVVGEYRWVESVFSSTFLTDESFSVLMASTREMDAIVRAEQAARGANAKLNLLNGIIRHDMLNQITGMIGYLDILSDIVEGEDVLRLIAKEQDIVTRIRRLVDLTRDYQGIGLHPPGFIDVDATVYKIFSRPEFAGTIDAHRSLDGLFIYADRMFEQVIFEMVANSLRYGGEGVFVRLSYDSADEGLIIVLADNGPGIEEEEKHHIFSRNYQNRRGYGLYLATEILDITGIQIREVGVFGEGARFEIIVPPDGYRIVPAARSHGE